MEFQTLRKSFLTTAQVARWLGVAPRTLRLWAECDVVPAFKIGSQWRFREQEIQQWIEKGAALKKSLGRDMDVLQNQGISRSVGS